MALTKSQRTQLEKLLKEERDRTLRALNRSTQREASESTREQAGDLSAVPHHLADLGTDTMQEELDLTNASRMSQQLNEIDAALQRLYSAPEEFGICERTKKPIPFARLEIIPWARTCDEAET
ncbi:MAG TPA: TraR/DksA C4-type zinc finger protein [Gemmatimonadaceae bacterium]|nr:TraR/DksA C4-type zinc finger protein [Gemmatimonadaceae bacterium]